MPLLSLTATTAPATHRVAGALLARRCQGSTARPFSFTVPSARLSGASVTQATPIFGGSAFQGPALKVPCASSALTGGSARLASVLAMSSDVPSLVSPAWLKDNLAGGGIQVLDGTWYMPNAGRDALAEFQGERIPGSAFFSSDVIADTSSGLPHMLPSAEMFAAAVSAMGITNDTHVVVYDRHGVFSAPRVWWTFRTMGHSKVSVLEGGLPAWKAAGGDIETSEVEEADKVKLGITPALSSPGSPAFSASKDGSKVRDLKQMWENVDAPTDQVVDARSSGRFYGTAPEPRAGMRGGHIPGSKSVPFDTVLTEGKAGLKSPEIIRSIFEEAGLQLDGGKPIVASCGSGMTACVLALALDQIGQPLTAVYDGSWTEWGNNQEVPVVTED